MNNRYIRNSALIRMFVLILFAAGAAQAGGDSAIESMKKSLVYLEISSYGYEQLQPWRNTEIRQKRGVGCAVGDYEVITPAWNLIDAKLIKARVFGQNEYIPAKIKVIDYELDLAIVALDINAMTKPLKPVRFAEKFTRGAKLNYYWLDSTGQINTGQGYLDRAEVLGCPTSYTQFLNFVVTNTSKETGIGQPYGDGSKLIGITFWNNGTSEAGLIPSVIINSFLARVKEKGKDYQGVAVVGFSTEELLDPAVRKYLKMPADMQDGVQVTDIYSIGTGSDSLKAGDVILAIDGEKIDARGRFRHKAYNELSFHHLIISHNIGDEIEFDIWRDGGRQRIGVEAKNFDVGEMLVPYYEYDLQPEYVVSGGYVFQKLSRPYLNNWGKDWAGKVTPHLLYYYRNMAFKPSEERKDIVILSYTLPAPINLGYKDLRQIVVSKFNGMAISCIGDIIEAQKLNPDSKYDVVEFEFDNPTIVIPRNQLLQADMLIARNYGIRKLVNVE